jgi:oligopeptide/dipeptide ABC transporter ATP-binding protein
VRTVCDRVAVMYAGRLAEVASTRAIFSTPRHPYTRALIDAVPDIRKPTDKLVTISGSPPSIYDQPSGCRFRPRCWLYRQLGEPERCRAEVPELALAAEHSDTKAACHFTEEAAKRSPVPA